MEIKNLKIDKILITKTSTCPDGLICIDWSANVGFGEYTLVLEKDGMLHAYTESMDNGENKEFSKAILAELLNKIVIED